MNRISRGWALTVQSWHILKKDRSLVVFPVLSTTFAILATLAIFIPAVLWESSYTPNPDDNDLALYLAGVVTAYVSTFIAIFFNVALAACAARSLRGEHSTVGYGINAAAQRIGPILGWTLLATTVGLILRALEERAPTLGRIAVWLVGAAWSIATFFVVPVLALEDAGPVDSLKRSATAVKARWGEGATGAATISLVTFAVAVPIVIVGALAGGALVNIGHLLPALVVFALTLAAVLVVAMISAALSQIFRVALYQYAATGQAVGGFDQHLLQGAFTDRRRWR